MSKLHLPKQRTTAFEPPQSMTEPDVARAEKVEAPEPAMFVSAQDDLPDLLLLTKDFGFAKNGLLRVWPANQPITNQADIAELLMHNAPVRCFKEQTNG